MSSQLTTEQRKILQVMCPDDNNPVNPANELNEIAEAANKYDGDEVREFDGQADMNALEDIMDSLGDQDTHQNPYVNKTDGGYELTPHGRAEICM